MTTTIQHYLAIELELHLHNVEQALKLYTEGSTIPFIARYRKELTGEMNEIVLGRLFERYEYIVELEERKKVILQSIETQGKLTDDLQQQIKRCTKKNELEDLYLPFKPKKRTRATIAKEKGLEPLARFLSNYNTPDARICNFIEEAEHYVNRELGVNNALDALQGACDILAEEISEIAALRALCREYMVQNVTIKTGIKGEFPEGTTKYEMYREFEISITAVQPHHILAMRRGEEEGVVTFDFIFDEEYLLGQIQKKIIQTGCIELFDLYKKIIKDSFSRLMKHSLIAEVRLQKKGEADNKSIETFGENLRNVLLASPAGMKPTLGIDPGFKTGCKVVALDDTGQFLEYVAIFPHTSSEEGIAKSKQIMQRLLQQYSIQLIAVGNGTAGRETEQFVKDLLQHHPEFANIVLVTVNESGASVYSASSIAIEEFPDQDITVRGAISIGRRLQDPMAELVKIDPKSIGVGQYQHDVDQKLLKKKLDEIVVSCVNYVGVDLNTASAQLLQYVSGINATIAHNIVKYRNINGLFRNRQALLEVPMIGKKTYEQAAGFLRIRGGDNPLDNTAVHPERYPVVQLMLNDLRIQPENLLHHSALFDSISYQKYVSGDIGEPTIKDIIAELKKPGRDPRSQFTYAQFNEGIQSLTDLRQGMLLEGIITNVANFGAFVDIGVHQDGLVHISQLANRFVSNPMDVVKVGQIVKVLVLDVNESLKRISLSIKLAQSGEVSTPKIHEGKKQTPSPTRYEDQLSALKNKFSKV